jgi:hypothetical protein
MNEAEWLTCEEPDLMLEAVEGKVTREQLVEFVRRCWERVTPYLPVQSDVTVVDQFAVLAGRQSDHDAALYAAEAASKAAGLAPAIKQEQRHQAAILRQIVDRPS